MENNISKLPARCYAVNTLTGNIIILERGMSGYYKTDIHTSGADESQTIVDEYNEKLGVSKAQVAAMYAGSMFGFHVPGSNPDVYDENGTIKKEAT